MAAGPATGPARDLDTRTEVHHLVVHFYRAIANDEVVGPVFGEVAEVDWAEHIPRLIDYWCRILLGEPGYSGAVFAAHRHVHDIEAFRIEHFDRWFEMWIDEIDQGWQGPHAQHAKEHAARVGQAMARRLLDVEWSPPRPIAG